MTIDPRELHALRRALDEFEASAGPRPNEKAVRVLQAGRRVVMLGTAGPGAEIVRGMPPRDPPPFVLTPFSFDEPTPAPRAPSVSGDLCGACGGMLAWTGTCRTCQQCGASGGCG